MKRNLLLCPLVFWFAAISAKPPNFVLILADDLGYADIGAYGNQVNRTPNLDRLARKGLRFTDFHSNAPNCTPTRAAILTGLYQQRLGIEGAFGEGAKGLSPETVTLAEKLKEAGYSTGLLGKWHLGYYPDNGPLDHGFDEFVGHLHGATDYISHVDKYGRRDWWHNREAKDEEGHNTTLITNHALRFIREKKDEPFFLFVSHSAIHFPWQSKSDPAHRKPGKRYESSKGKLGPHAKGPVQPVLQAMIEELDASVGEIVGELHEQGIAEDTLVFFTSDNGGIVRMKGLKPSAENRISDNAPWRGEKHGLYEGGHRVPTIAYWPGKIEAGRVSKGLSMTADLMPTFLELAGVCAVESDGVSLARHVLEGKELPSRTLFWRNRLSKAVRLKDWKLVRNHELPFELYDLGKNPSEAPKGNLMESRADIAGELLRRLAAWEKEVDGRSGGL